MYYSRRLLIAVITCLSTFQLYSSTTTDSLLQKINHTSGKEKLELIRKLALSQQDSKKVLAISRLLEKESKEQGDIQYQINSYSFRMKYFTYTSDIDSILFYTELIKRLCEEHNIKYPYLYYYMTRAHFNMGYYDLAIHNLNLLLEESKEDHTYYQLLGDAYMLSGRYTLAKKNYEKSLELCLQMAPNNIITHIGYYNNLILSLTYLGEYDKGLAACSTAEKLLENNKHKIDPTQVISFYLLIYSKYASIYVGLKDIKQSKYYLDKIEQIPMNNVPEVFKYDVYTTKAKYLYLLEEYHKSLDCVNEALSFYRKNNMYGRPFFKELSIFKIDVLKKLGDYKKAVEELDIIRQYNDSISRENIPLQISQLSKEFELEKAKIKQQEGKAKLEKSRILIVGLVVITILLGIILFIVRRNTKQLKEKNLILFRKNQDLEKYTSPRLKISTEEEKIKNMSLFDRIEAYILESEIFKDSALTRDDVAAALNTNRQYLTDAIKDETGKAFLDYINQFRLNYVYHQLVSSDESIPVNSIMYEAGFSSSSTFYRLFKEKFGMTPNEVRQAKADLKHQESKDRQIDNSF